VLGVCHDSKQQFAFVAVDVIERVEVGHAMREVQEGLMLALVEGLTHHARIDVFVVEVASEVFFFFAGFNLRLILLEFGLVGFVLVPRVVDVVVKHLKLGLLDFLFEPRVAVSW